MSANFAGSDSLGTLGLRDIQVLFDYSSFSVASVVRKSCKKNHVIEEKTSERFSYSCCVSYDYAQVSLRATKSAGRVKI